MKSATRLRHDEQGSVTIWMVLTAVTFMMIVGFVVDYSGKVHAMQYANDVANQAARVAGNQVRAAPAVRGEKVIVDSAAAAAAARRYLAAAGVQGSVTFTSPNTLQVNVQATYQPVFLGALGMSSTQVRGEATAYLARVVDGVER